MTSDSTIAGLKELRFHCFLFLATGLNCLASQKQSCPKNECMITSRQNFICPFDLTTCKPCSVNYLQNVYINIFFLSPPLFMSMAKSCFLMESLLWSLGLPPNLCEGKFIRTFHLFSEDLEMRKEDHVGPLILFLFG